MNQLFLPNVFLVGAAKSGTTTLHRYLKSFPDICMSVPKEPFFFEAFYNNGLDYYQKTYFPHWKGESLIGEARHRNLYLPYVPKRIYETNPDAKIIAILRDPVTRCYSHWSHNYSRLSESFSFEKAVKKDLERIEKGLHCDTPEEIEGHIKGLKNQNKVGEVGLGLYRTYVDSGYYLDQLKRYYDLFPKENIHVIILEEYKKDYKTALKKLTEFIGIEAPSSLILEEKWANKQKGKNLHPKYQQWLWKHFPSSDPYRFTDEFKIWLYDHYKIRNNELAEFLNINLTTWKM